MFRGRLLCVDRSVHPLPVRSQPVLVGLSSDDLQVLPGEGRGGRQD